MDVQSWSLSLQKIKNEWSHYDDLAAKHRQRMLIYEDLEKMGLGLEKLKLLNNTINELALENYIPQSTAVDMFFADLTETCEKKIKADPKFQYLTREMDSMKTELSSLKAKFCPRGDMASTLGEFTLIGFEQQQIRSLANVLD